MAYVQTQYINILHMNDLKYASYPYVTLTD